MKIVGLLPCRFLGDAEDWAVWAEWLRDSKGRRQLTWSGELREFAGLLAEKSDEDMLPKALAVRKTRFSSCP